MILSHILKLYYRVLSTGAFCAGFIALSMSPLSSVASPPDWWPAACTGAYRIPDEAAQARAAELFAQLFADDAPQASTSAWAELGFRLSREQWRGETVWLLRPETCSGQGIYMFRPHVRSRVVLQMPHQFKDLDTGRIGLALSYRAAAWNSLPRDKADLAHREDSFFHAFSRAFAAQMPHGRLVQLHGFAAGKRATAAARRARIILSAGQRRATPAVTALAACLRRFFPAVRVYPDEVTELGGTSNAQGALLRASGHDGFVHLEMNRDLRRRLRDDSAQRQYLAQCLSEMP